MTEAYSTVKRSKDKIILIILGVIVILLAIGMLMPVLGNIFKPEVPKQGEKYRFMRYLSCAVAMCTNGYWSPEILSVELEYDAGGKVTLGCNDFMKARFPGLAKGDTRCGRSNSITYVFNDDAEYIGYRPDPCGLKSGWQTDMSCILPWDDFLACEIKKCYLDLLGDKYVEGRLIDRGTMNPCGTETSYTPNIYVSNALSTTKCTVYKNLFLERCNFQKDDVIYIWTDLPTIFYSTFCTYGFCVIPSPIPILRTIPQIAICETS